MLMRFVPWVDDHWLESLGKVPRHLGNDGKLGTIAGKDKLRHYLHRGGGRSRGRRSFQFKGQCSVFQRKPHSPHDFTNHHFAALFRLVLPYSTHFHSTSVRQRNSSWPIFDISDVHIM
jgi:hypothetical protein